MESGERKRTTAYMLYAKGQRASVLAEHPGIGVAEQAKIIGAKWKALSTDEQKAYSTKAAEWNATVVVTAPKPAANKNTSANASMNLPDTVLPMARVKRIAKLDDSIRTVGAEAVFALTVATECFIESLTNEVIGSFTKQKRGVPGAVTLTKKTISSADIVKTIHKNRLLSFLRHDFPLSLLEGLEKRKTDTDAALTSAENDAEAAHDGDKPAAKPSNAVVEMFAKAAAEGKLLPPRQQTLNAEAKAAEDKGEEADVVVDGAVKAKTPAGKGGKAGAQKGNGSSSSKKTSKSSSVGLLGTFVRTVTAEEARLQNEAKLEATHITKPAISGHKRSKSSTLRDADDGGEEEEEETNIAAIRAIAEGKKQAKKTTRGKQKRKVQWDAVEAEDEAAAGKGKQDDNDGDDVAAEEEEEAAKDDDDLFLLHAAKQHSDDEGEAVFDDF